MNISSRWRLAAAVSPLALAIAATPAIAADAAATQAVVTGTATAAAVQLAPPPSDTAANPANSDEPAAQQIVVTGFRASLRSATAKKKNSEAVVESITAEDVGKLPDNGIGESIARLPGLAAQRDHGRASGISIRGKLPATTAAPLSSTNIRRRSSRALTSTRHSKPIAPPAAWSATSTSGLSVPWTLVSA